ncbi:unnamed protein product [Paramecium sonneborni]|uniref:Uncharacterized protein n=1 Tax=Paramecium sonneborni TaxID=65129 RepID=A0A8S1RAG3_9CILI|nr:unnamed protein product [Paramecium sonneborni]
MTKKYNYSQEIIFYINHLTLILMQIKKKTMQQVFDSLIYDVTIKQKQNDFSYLLIDNLFQSQTQKIQIYLFSIFLQF